MGNFIDGAIVTVAALAIFITGVGIGSVANDSGWRNDCQKLGAHISGEKVYTCKFSSLHPTIKDQTNESQ